MKNKVLAQVSDAEVEWISAKVFCQTLNKGMFSCGDSVSLPVFWNKPHYVLCEDQVTCSCLCSAAAFKGISLTQDDERYRDWWVKEGFGFGDFALCKKILKCQLF